MKYEAWALFQLYSYTEFVREDFVIWQWNLACEDR